MLQKLSERVSVIARRVAEPLLQRTSTKPPAIEARDANERQTRHEAVADAEKSAQRPDRQPGGFGSTVLPGQVQRVYDETRARQDQPPSSFVQRLNQSLADARADFRLERAEPTPFDGNAIFEALRTSKVVEVALPDGVGDIVGVMTTIANRAYKGMGHEYGLFLYVDNDGAFHALATRGGWFVTSTAVPGKVAENPEGMKMLYFGTLAHTHPFGAPIASTGDHQHMRQLELAHRLMGAPFVQRLSVLVVPGGAHSVFDGAKSYHVAPANLDDSWGTALFRAPRS